MREKVLNIYTEWLQPLQKTEEDSDSQEKN